ncbi:MAG: tRNA (adenosine(37)-N6)-dimethylallyltransferase MiaA [Aerococcus sp.]|nr:tRNA (adenosine(37)-N6)-dimethylallyltransferase MiaA [Aerococcus sp.]
MPKKRPLIVIAGPTAVGKTQLSIALAHRVHGEIVNSDSMQIYRDLQIGTAAPSLAEQDSVRHHLLNFQPVDVPYSVAEFQQDATAAIQAIYQRHNVPIVVGGTGLYLQALLYDFSLGGKNEHPHFRSAMQSLAETNGAEWLHHWLEQVDKKSAEAIHPNNVRRVIRALEVATYTEQRLSEQTEDQRQHSSRYDVFLITLNTERALLYERINQRVDQMMKAGLLSEAEWLYQQHLPETAAANQAIGYKEFFPYFAGEETLEIAVEKLKRSSRRYAKRQLTWLRHRLPEGHEVNLVEHPEQEAEIIQAAVDFLKQHRMV